MIEEAPYPQDSEPETEETGEQIAIEVGAGSAAEAEAAEPDVEKP
jgi:hypothetical protein